MTTQERIEKMLKKSEVIIGAGGPKAIAKQHERGKMTARERIAALLDEGSFVELDRFVRHRCNNFGQEKKDLPGEGVTTGYGTIDGRLVYVFSQDFTVEGGSLGEMHANKIAELVSRKQSTHWAAMANCSLTTPFPPALSPRFPLSWDRPQAALFTARL